MNRNFRCFVLFALCLSGVAQSGAADFAPQVWVNPGLYSLHFDRNKNLREDNVGFGAEARVAEDHVLMGGTFINSVRVRSHYAAYQWRPLHWKPAGIDVGAGIAVSAFDGYPGMRNGGWFVVPLPILAIEGRYVGVNLTVVPTIKNRLDGAVAAQIKIRIW